MSLNQYLNPWSLESKQIETILEKALSHGGQFSELFFENVSASTLVLENGKMDQVQEGFDQGVGLRVIAENQTYYAYTTDVGLESLISLADDVSKAVSLSIKNSKPTAIKTAWKENQSQSEEIENYKVQESMRTVSLKDKVKIVERIDQGARKVLPSALQVTALTRDAERKILVCNSDAEFATHTKNYFQMVGMVVASKDQRMESTHAVVGGFVGQELMKKHSPESIGEEAAKRVEILLSASPAPSGSLPVVLSSEAGGTMIHEAVGHGLEADLACNGLSVYQDKLGEKVAHPKVSVIDDGTIPELRGSYSVDDEGTSSSKNVLIENGVLKSYLVDRLSAEKFNLEKTGNGRRESFRHKPIVRMTNTFIEPGNDKPEDILSATAQGVFVKSMGGGQVNTASGDFVFTVTEGYLIKDGKLAEPIRGATLVGNGPKVLQMIDQVGTDLDFQPGTCGKDGQAAPVTSAQPTIRIKELTIGGEVPSSDYFAS